MKKIFSTLLVAAMSLTACADNEQIITFEQLPAQAQSTVKTHLANEAVSYVMMDREGLSKEYEVKFASGSSIEFESDGSLKKVDCDVRAVPEALVPEAVRRYVQAQFPNAFITEWGKDGRRWKAELNSGLDLEFNNRYEFQRIDD